MLRGEKPGPDVRREASLDERAVQPGAPLRRRRPKTGPQIDSLRTCEDGIEREHRKEIRIADSRRMVRKLQIRGRALSRYFDAPFTKLLGFDDADAPRRWTRRNAAKLLFDAAQHLVGIHIADDNDRGVVRDIVPPVILV